MENEPNKETFKNDPAFPILDPNGSYYREGVSTRAYFAAMAMQGLLANETIVRSISIQMPPTLLVPEIERMAVTHADALIAELNKETK